MTRGGTITRAIIITLMGGLLLCAGSWRLVFSRPAPPANQPPSRYRADRDGETVRLVPVDPEQHTAMLRRARTTVQASRRRVTDPRLPAGSYVYTPGASYTSYFFARDFLFFLEGAGRYFVRADEVRTAVDFLALAQLTDNRRVGTLTYPRGAIPDHLTLNGAPGWGFGNVPAPRPSMDEAFCFITLAWHAGEKAGWDAGWQRWFRTKATRFTWAWESVPRNPRTGLVTQWTTPGHIGANDIAEDDGACVMWGFHDSYAFPGDDLGCSVLACNAARALADMHAHAGNPAAVYAWSTRADAMQDAIRAQFRYDPLGGGYLPWGVGSGAPTMASPDITGYAVWSGLLTGTQADAASDWFAACYRHDRAIAVPGDLFMMLPGGRGAVRMARKQDDCQPDVQVWPAPDSRHWQNFCASYNAYQDGGYWYYMSLPICAALWRKNPSIASEWVQNIYTDINAGGWEYPPERWDNHQPLGNAYLASISSVIGMSNPDAFRLSTSSLHLKQPARWHISPE